MGEILGIGVTHYPGLIQPDEAMAGLLEPHAEQRPGARGAEGPGALARADAQGMGRPARRRQGAPRPAGRRLPQGRKALDAFDPDFVLIWGDDQYENFREDGVPSFCVFACDEIESRPYAR